MLQACVESDGLEVEIRLGDEIPQLRRTRAASRYHLLSYPETGRTHGSVCNRPAAQPRLPLGGTMEALIERACGLDVHQASVVACLLTGSANGKVKKVLRTFGTTTRDLLACGSG